MLFPRPLYRFIGFAFVQCYLLALFSSDLLLPGEGVPLELIPWLHCLTSAITIIVTAALLTSSARMAPICRRYELNVLAGFFGVGGSLLIILVSTSTIDIHWVYLGYALAVICCIWLVLCWQEYYATQGVRAALVGLALATVAGTLLFFFLNLLPHPVGAVTVVALPLLGYLSLRPQRNARFYTHEHTADSTGGILSGVAQDWSPRLLAVFACVSLGYGAIRLMTMPPDSAVDAFYLLRLGGGVGIASFVALILLSLAQSRGLANALYFAIPAGALGIVCYGLPINGANELAVVLSSFGFYLLQYLVLAMMIERSVARKVPVLGLFALLNLAGFVGTLAGQLLGRLWPFPYEFLGYIFLLAVLVGALLLARARNWLVVPQKVLDSPPMSETEQRLLDVADSARLTIRETEVLRIWLAGHNQAYIEQTLFISKNTIKTHLKNIYRKTNTANREELLQLLDN
jgi:DNA-binding CsgD family transcriptional regulator